jgi:hypothetical protein
VRASEHGNVRRDAEGALNTSFFKGMFRGSPLNMTLFGEMLREPPNMLVSEGMLRT